MTLIEQATKAKTAKYKVALLSTDAKNEGILAVADALVNNSADTTSSTSSLD